jgi:hypothetical protein
MTGGAAAAGLVAVTGCGAVPAARASTARASTGASAAYQLGADVADVAVGGDVVYALDEHGGVYALRI